MKTLVVFFALLGLTLSALVLPTKRECASSDDCDDGQCCAEEPNPFIASKRAVLLPDKSNPMTWQPKKYCYSYIKENAWCGGIWRGCGCSQGLKCLNVMKPPEILIPDPPVPTDLVAPSKRGLAFGDWRCVKEN
ncbi:uncharacterized protein LOC106157749 [Lingula anatina]|uniref:Uncharacterized protein LOC106157749 n=1 Tax=Lingula anatina TaxID=7574 RepID=A0A1S3HSD6_LINAN|nr:uncharacterized protein LOC106157749 [Lingula anatina]|eukprot:XP_013388947.1 uncharacterized protein LOC106157749 [Lingula anatina]